MQCRESLFPRVRDTKWANTVDRQRLESARKVIRGWQLYIIDGAGITIEKLTATARLYVRTKKVRLICVDYVQIVNAQGRDERLRVAAISRGLTKLAKSEQVAVIALSQLARPDRAGTERLPKASDLRESSQLENDASVIVLLHRPRSDDEGRLLSEGELVVAKNRHGETTSIQITYSRSSLLFEQIQSAPVAEARAS